MSTLQRSTACSNILLVDDTPDNLRLLSKMLESQGYKIRKTTSGKTALQAAQIEPPDLILLDINMPEMNGYEVFEQLRSDEKTCDVPVIFISALNQTIDKIKAFEMGGMDYITKPFQEQEVLARVKTQLTICRQKQQLIDQNHKLEQEVYEHQRAEQELQLLNAKFEESNRELERFAFIASHDLKEPLRTACNFSLLLQNQCRSSLSIQEQDYLERIQVATQRMQVLIDDLLALSQVSTDARAFVPVDLTQIVQDVAVNLEQQIQQSNGQLQIGTLPIVEANPNQMLQLFQNLISNALKFRRPEEPPVIKIYLQTPTNTLLFKTPLNKVCQIVVEDNGVGFDETYCDRIFRAFERLHDRSKYEGTGIGLAICQKIVERHGGKITAHSTLGHGARFLVTLPLNQS
jgi:two-component system, sensor histidine kinase and response regulator